MSTAAFSAPSVPVPGNFVCRPKDSKVKRDAGQLKIGLLIRVPEGWNEETDLTPDCESAVNDAARLCENLGHVVEEVPAAQLSYPEIPLHVVSAQKANYFAWQHN